MRIASITMVGQFPHGIDLHVRNLRWALSPQDRIFVVTLPEIIARQQLVGDDQVVFVPCEPDRRGPGGLLHFWRHLPEILDRHDIDPDRFLFMEQDIWFFDRPALRERAGAIRSFLPGSHYHNVMAGGRMLHPRVWEGAQLVDAGLVGRALDAAIDFSIVPETFLDRHRAAFEAEAGGAIGLSDYGKADTMDEFALYCALVEKTTLEYDVRAAHIRGPEVLHRRFPEIYRGATAAELAHVQQRVPYLDSLLAVAAYFVAGLWSDVGHLDWRSLRPESARLLRQVLETAAAWMRPDELGRLRHVEALASG